MIKLLRISADLQLVGMVFFVGQPEDGVFKRDLGCVFVET